MLLGTRNKSGLCVPYGDPPNIYDIDLPHQTDSKIHNPKCSRTGTVTDE